MDITKTRYYKAVLYASATILFLNALGVGMLSSAVDDFWTSGVTLMARVCEFAIYYHFFRVFDRFPDRFYSGLTRVIMIGKLCMVCTVVLVWTEFSVFLVLEGIVSVVVTISLIILFVALFLKESHPDPSFRAIKLFAGMSLCAIVVSFAIGSNLLHATDVRGNIESGKIFIYQIPQIVLALPYLVLFRVVSNYRPDGTPEMVKA